MATSGLTRAITASLVAILLTAISGLDTNTAATEPVLVDGRGTWTLSRLGYGDLEAHPTAAGENGRFNPLLAAYRLPPAASQGDPDWYILHIRLQIEVSPGSGSGLAYVTASTNDHAAALIKLEVTRTDEDLSTTWSDYGLIDGSRSRTTESLSVADTYSNYLQVNGVQPGDNELSFSIREFGEARLQGLTVFSDSSIEVTGEGPTKLNVSLSAPRSVAIGRPFQLEYQIDNLREVPANDVRIEALVDGGLSIVGAATATADAIDAEFRGKIELVLSQEVGTVSLVVTSEGERAVGSVQISVREPRPWWYGIPLSGVLLTLGGGLMDLYVAAPYARRRLFARARVGKSRNSR